MDWRAGRLKYKCKGLMTQPPDTDNKRRTTAGRQQPCVLHGVCRGLRGSAHDSTTC
jgi:hypothetical protein